MGRRPSFEEFKEKFIAEYRPEYAAQRRAKMKAERRVFENDCATKAVVYRDFQFGAYDDSAILAIGGCGRWDCLPCSIKRARQTISYVAHATKDWKNLLMFTFTLRAFEGMNREVHRKVLAYSFRDTLARLTQPFLKHIKKMHTYLKTGLSWLAYGRFPDLKYIRFFERHQSGFLHIHMLCDSFIPFTLIDDIFCAQVESWAFKLRLLDNCSDEDIENWGSHYRDRTIDMEKCMASWPFKRMLKKQELRDFLKWREESKYELTIALKNGHVDIMYPKPNLTIGTNLRNYVTKMSLHHTIPPNDSKAAFGRNLVAVSLAGYLSKDMSRREAAVELARRYPYNKLHFVNCRVKTVQSRAKWIEENKSGL